MKGVFANRNDKRDFVVNELEAQGIDGCNVFMAVAFFTESNVIDRLIAKGCTIWLVVRLGFPTNPRALEQAMKHPQVRLRFYTGHSFHPKLYIFGDRTALVGSANLTGAAIVSNQEVVVSIESSDERFFELAEIFDGYWSHAEVLTDDALKIYKALYQEYAKHEAAADQLGRSLLDKLGDTSPPNITRERPKATSRSLFLSDFRKTYQEGVAAFNIVRDAYKATGYRKVDEVDIPLRIEIDSFISYVRETQAKGESWRSAPLRNAEEQGAIVKGLIEEWRKVRWPHFEDRIVGTNYPLLKRTFSSRESILAADDGELFDALATLHSFHDRFRFFDGGLPTWRKEFPKFNKPEKVRDTLAYLVFGKDDVETRMANVIYDARYKLAEFGQANVQELIGWCNREELPIINGRTTKVLKYFGSKVRQL